MVDYYDLLYGLMYLFNMYNSDNMVTLIKHGILSVYITFLSHVLHSVRRDLGYIPFNELAEVEDTDTDAPVYAALWPVSVPASVSVLGCGVERGGKGGGSGDGKQGESGSGGAGVCDIGSHSRSGSFSSSSSSDYSYDSSSSSSSSSSTLSPLSCSNRCSASPLSSDLHNTLLHIVIDSLSFLRTICAFGYDRISSSSFPTPSPDYYPRTNLLLPAVSVTGGVDVLLSLFSYLPHKGVSLTTKQPTKEEDVCIHIALCLCYLYCNMDVPAEMAVVLAFVERLSNSTSPVYNRYTESWYAHRLENCMTRVHNKEQLIGRYNRAEIQYGTQPRLLN